MKEEDASRSVLSRLLKLAPSLFSADPDAANATAGPNGTNTTIGGGKGVVEGMRDVNGTFIASVAPEGRVRSGGSGKEGESPDYDLPIHPGERREEEEEREEEKKKREVTSNANNATANATAKNETGGEAEEDAYAKYRKLFAPQNDTAEFQVALKEQPVTEYTNQTVRCFPMNDKGEIFEVRRSAAFCWYHPRYCQLMCEEAKAHEWAPRGSFNDPGSPRGDAWTMWKATLHKLGGRGVANSR